MLRLRTTTTLSLLALVLGVAGTQWLSDQTGSSADVVAAPVSHTVIAHRVTVRHVAQRMHATAPRSAMTPRVYSAVEPMAAPTRRVSSEPVAWVPLSMPISAMPFTRLRHHDIGNLVLHLVVDGQGRVAQARLAQSSGDDVLDANALALAQRWRFAVPVDRPQGFSGDLPLSFTSAASQFAQTP